MSEATLPQIALIVAMAENRVIGKNQRLPWHLPADLKHFKQLTLHHPIIMGRKTFESIGKPLLHRTNIVMTRDPHFKADGTFTVTSVDEAMQCAITHRAEEADDIFIIGGAELYKLWLPYSHRIYLTLVHHPFDGDTYFPKLSPQEWKEISREEHEADEKNAYGYGFLCLEKSLSKS